ncbi:hypothetical protein J1605_013042 [Eschrichtius robustus]|uniref:10 kDa heat shock protein, mitochondrial n=1 Tax=Eschrichtius robustus TaxID=9764 RepID=A0AB34GI85_ESCRO|nr:hypothetical protein J1605_013042 [Eschrichtius robustus]
MHPRGLAQRAQACGALGKLWLSPARPLRAAGEGQLRGPRRMGEAARAAAYLGQQHSLLVPGRRTVPELSGKRRALCGSSVTSRHFREGRRKAGQAFRKFLPLFDRVLVERSAPEVVTKGGIMLPEKSQGKVLQAMVVAVGSGSKGKGGEIQPVSVKVGDKVLLPEYGGTKVVLDDKDYFLFRDGDILGKYVD